LLRAIDEAAFRKLAAATGAYGEPVGGVGPMEALMAVLERKTRVVTVMNLSPASAEAYRAGMHDVSSLPAEEAAAKIAELSRRTRAYWCNLPCSSAVRPRAICGLKSSTPR